MSGEPTVNVVDDEEMSSQGSVNAPVAPQGSPTHGQVTAQAPTSPFMFSTAVTSVAQTQQSGIAGTRGTARSVPPIESTEVVAAPTLVVDAPTRVETKRAFDEVTSVLRSASSQQQEMRAEM